MITLRGYGLRITKEMHQILLLHLKGFSGHKISHMLNLHEPTVYSSLKAAKRNFSEADRMIADLKALGWPQKLVEVEENQRRRTASRIHVETPENQGRPEELALKLG